MILKKIECLLVTFNHAIDIKDLSLVKQALFYLKNNVNLLYPAEKEKEYLRKFLNQEIPSGKPSIFTAAMTCEMESITELVIDYFDPAHQDKILDQLIQSNKSVTLERFLKMTNDNFFSCYGSLSAVSNCRRFKNCFDAFKKQTHSKSNC